MNFSWLSWLAVLLAVAYDDDGDVGVGQHGGSNGTPKPERGLIFSPGNYQKWIGGDVMRNGNKAAKARHELFSGLESSLFP